MHQLTELDIADLSYNVRRKINPNFIPLSSMPYKDTIPTYDEAFALNYLHNYAHRTFAEVKFILNDLSDYKLLQDFATLDKTRILDLGCGSGSGSLAVVDFLRNELKMKVPIYVYLADKSPHQLTVASKLHELCGIKCTTKPREIDIFGAIFDYAKKIGRFDFVIISKALNEFICTTTTYKGKADAEKFLSSYVDNIFNRFMKNTGILIAAETAEYNKKTTSFGDINLRRTFNKIIFNTEASSYIILPRICAARLSKPCGETLKNCDWWRHEEIRFRNSSEDVKFMYYCFSKTKKEVRKKHGYVMYGGKRSPKSNRHGEQLVCSSKSFGYQKIHPPKHFEEAAD